MTNLGSSYTVLASDLGKDIYIVATAIDGTKYIGQVKTNAMTVVENHPGGSPTPSVVPSAMPSATPSVVPSAMPSATPSATPKPINAQYMGNLPLQAGDILQASNVTVIGPDHEIVPPADYSIQFYLDGQPIPNNYVLGSGDIGKQVTYQVVANGKDNYTGTVTEHLGNVGGVIPTPTATPTLAPGASPRPTADPNATATPTPTPKVIDDVNYGGNLPAEVGQNLNKNDVTVTDKDGNTVPKDDYTVHFIVGGQDMGDNYTLQPGDLGKTIDVEAIAVPGSGYEGQAQKPMGMVTADTSPTATVAPTATLKPFDAYYKGNLPLRTGDTLDAANVSVIGPNYETVPPADYTIQFYVGGVAVPNDYTLTPNDIGKQVTFTVTAVPGSEYTGSVTKPLGNVADANGNIPTPSPRTSLAPNATPYPTDTPKPLADVNYGGTVPPEVGQILDKGDVTVTDADGNTVPPSEYTVDFIVGGQDMGANYTLTEADLGKKIDVKAVAVDGSGYVGTAQGPLGTVAPPSLIKDDHFAYMQGYPGGYFNPEGSMTRAEVAVMFTRLMTKNAAIPKATGLFPDVQPGAWYADAVEYLAKAGIMTGRDATWFDPNAPISRAEFAAVASRYDNLSAGTMTFTDVPAGYWAYSAIASAAAKGWVTGYGDGTFRPMANITRAEVVTIVNRMLNRVFDSSYSTTNMITYTDVPTNYWGYGDIEEASNSHDFQIINGQEIWTGLNSEDIKY